MSFAQPQLDPTAPVFFMSYPRIEVPDAVDPGEMRAHVTRFFADLTANVAELLPLEHGHTPGFLDGQMRGGELWEDELLHAVGSCQVFVPLLSPRFMMSRWCRFEWETFSRRTVRARARSGHPVVPGPQAAIVPVSWVATDPARLPPAVARVQAFAPHPADQRTLDAYKNDGVFGLRKMRSETEYGVVVWRLAQLIVDIVYRYEVEPRIPKDTSGLGESFMEDVR